MHYDGAIVIGTLEISISALAEVNLLLYDTEESRMANVILLCQRLLTKAPHRHARFLLYLEDGMRNPHQYK